MIGRGETVEPRWKEILDIVASPTQQKVVASSDPNSPDSWDGAWDAQAMSRGLGMRRIHADIGRQRDERDVAHAFIFVCQCGYHRRVITESEHSFTCERPNASGVPGCDIYWQMETYQDENDINPKSGLPTTKAVMEERKLPNGRKMMFPKITGMSIHEARANARKRRLDAAGNYTPQAGVLTPGTKEAEHLATSPVVAQAKQEDAKPAWYKDGGKK